MVKTAVYLFIFTFLGVAFARNPVRPLATVLTERGYLCEAGGGRKNLMHTLTGTFGRDDINSIQSIKSEAEIDEWMSCYTSEVGRKNYQNSKKLLQEVAVNFGVPYSLMACKIWQETHWMNGEISPENARGLVQIIPPQVKTLKDIMDLASDPPKELDRYRELIKKHEDNYDKIKKIEDFMTSLKLEDRDHATACALQRDCDGNSDKISPHFLKKCDDKEDVQAAMKVDCTTGYKFSGENDALDQYEAESERLAGQIKEERKKDIVRNYDHGIVLRSAWQDWSVKNNLDSNLCPPKGGCASAPYNNIKWAIGAGGLNAMYLMIKLDDDYSQKPEHAGEKMNYSREEFQLIMAAAYNSGQNGPVQELKPVNEKDDGAIRIKKFIEDIRRRGAPGRTGWGQTACYVNNMDSCLRPKNMRPASFENPSGPGERCGQGYGVNLTKCGR